MITTTLSAIRKHSPCEDGWKKLLSRLGKTRADDEPLLLTKILDSNGLDDALWCLCAVNGYEREIRLYAVWCARQVQHLMTDPRSIAALDVAERFARGEATKAKLEAARMDALSAASAAYASADAAAVARAAASAAYASADAAAYASADAAAVARAAASAAAYASAAAGAASEIRERQAARFRQVFGATGSDCGEGDAIWRGEA
jgi:hypothetical protein